jgi:hypothetical protein
VRLQRGIADWWLIVIAAVVILSLISGIVYGVKSWGEGLEERGYKRGKSEVQLKMDKFISETRLAGVKAETESKAKEAADKLLKEGLDVTNNDLRRDLAAARERLRDERARPRGGVLPAPVPSARGDEEITFDRPQLDGALERFVSGTEELAGEGAAAIIDLDTGREWVRKIAP